MRPDLTQVLSWDDDTLLTRLAEVVTELAGLASEAARAKVAERRAKAKAWRDSQEATIAGRERAAEHASLDLTCEVWELQGEIAALAEEKALLYWLLDRHGPS